MTIPPLGSVTFSSVIGYNDLRSGIAPLSSNYGTGVGELGGSTPGIASTNPVLGAPLTVSVRTTSASPSGVLLIGLAPTSVPSCGIELLVNSVASGGLAFAGGSASFTLPALCNPQLAGLSIYWQAFIVDAGSPSPCYPLIHTAGLQTRFGD